MNDQRSLDSLNVEGKKLKSLLSSWAQAVYQTSLPQPPTYDGPDIQISLLTEKTSEVQPGSCFVARVRETSDGHPYIGKAIENGASMILAQKGVEEIDVHIPPGVVYLQVPDTAVAIAWLAAAWESYPSRQLVTIGITGTDGKTTTANVLLAILRAAGFQTGLLSTTRVVIGAQEELLALHVTTPEAPVVQHHLRRMVDAGLTHCILEATSHGLAQHRVSAVDFDVSVVTNITHEHLDYHGDFDNYLAAKSRLFKVLTASSWKVETHCPAKENQIKTTVLNRDDEAYVNLAAIPAPRQLTFGLRSGADAVAKDISYSGDGTRFVMQLRERQFPQSPPELVILTPLAGEFNVYNTLAASVAALAVGVGSDAINDGLQQLEDISGRMELIDQGQPFTVIVDFAHTPNALSQAITAARQMTDGRIITVFGSAGKRDIAKRRSMAQVSARQADLTILTAEDPRTESLDEILQTMADGCLSQGGQEGETFWRVPDRGQAIYFGLSLAQPGDLVLVCGKGHEQSMCFGTIEYPWDDRDATRAALEALATGIEMPDLGLPTYSRRGGVN